MLKVGIVGCGKIADDHGHAIQRCAGAQLIAACDREPLMAGQFAERFRVAQTFTEVGAMLSSARPDVVHITTPPQGHFAIARQCLERGVHVYVEKPFTVTAEEADSLIALADARSVKLTVGHDLQFTHVARDLRQLVRNGFLGGAPVHLESYYCYDLSDARYAKALLGDKEHWVRRLPGGLLQNIISHGIARIAEHFPSDTPEVIAQGFTSATLRGIGETQIIDELRVLLRDPSGPTASFTFSSQMRPSLRRFRIYGPRQGLEIDEDQQTLVRLQGTPLKSYAERILSPWRIGGQYRRNAWRNLRLLLRRDFSMKAGMQFLVAEFYRSISENTPPPIPYHEIGLTARIMDAVFRQITPPPVAP